MRYMNINDFKEYWLEKSMNKEDTFIYSVHVRLPNGEEFDLEDEIKATTSYDADRLITDLLSMRYPRARFSKYHLMRK